MPRNNPDIRAPEGTTSALASYLTSVASQALPEDVALKSKGHLIDTIAAMNPL